MNDTTPPADVHPESGNRLSLIERAGLDDAAAQVYDRLTDARGGSLVGLRGPGGIRLHSPTLAAHSAPVNHYLRNETGFSGRVRELAILVTARALDSQFEWAAHEPAALKEGLPAETIDIVRHRRSADGLPETEAAVIALGRELFGDRRVTPETFAHALALFGACGLVDLVSLMAQYSATASLLTAFDMQLRPGQEPPLPMP